MTFRVLLIGWAISLSACAGYIPEPIPPVATNYKQLATTDGAGEIVAEAVTCASRMNTNRNKGAGLVRARLWTGFLGALLATTGTGVTTIMEISGESEPTVKTTSMVIGLVGSVAALVGQFIVGEKSHFDVYNRRLEYWNAARAYLRQPAKLVTTANGKAQLSEKGSQVLQLLVQCSAANPAEINVKMLEDLASADENVPAP